MRPPATPRRSAGRRDSSACSEGTGFVLAALSARGDDRESVREPRRGAGGLGPCSRPAGVRTRMGWEGWIPLRVSRTRPPARRLWSLASRFGASRPLGTDPAGFGALSASARTRVFHRDGRGRRQDAGRRAHVSRRRPGGGGPRDTALRGRARRRVNRDPLFAGRSHRRDVADPCGSAPRADAAPLSNASGSAPSRTGRHIPRIRVMRCQRFFLGRLPARQIAAAVLPSRSRNSGGAHGRGQRLQSHRAYRHEQ